MTKDVIQHTKGNMDKSVEVLRKEFQKVRTGRASTGLLDEIKVDYYGTPTPISQVAALAVPEPRTVTIQPWETNLIPAIEKAILKSDLGLTPGNDGKLIRINLPPLTEERRKEIVKGLKKMAEDAKIAVRNVRRDAIEQLKKLEKDKKITEDELKRAEKEVQDITDGHVHKIDEVVAHKEKEVLEV